MCSDIRTYAYIRIHTKIIPMLRSRLVCSASLTNSDEHIQDVIDSKQGSDANKLLEIIGIES